MGTPEKRISRQAALGALGVAAATISVPSVALAESPRPLIALVHTQAAGDDGLIDNMIANLRRLALVEQLSVRFIYAADPTNYEPILRLLGEAGASVVLTTFEEMGEPLKSVAPSFPRTRFVQIYGDPMMPTIANVRTVEYDAYAVSFLAGVLAAYITKTGKIAYVAGSDLPSLVAAANALIAGAHSVNRRLKVAISFVGSYQDPAKAYDIAAQLFQSGIDFIELAAAGSDLGAIQCANARPGRMLCAESPQHFALGPASVTSILHLDFGKSARQEAEAALKQNWLGGHVHSGLRDGVLDFETSPSFSKLAASEYSAAFRDALPHIARAKKKIIDGSLRVPLSTRLA